MSLETATLVPSLVATNPLSTDAKSQGDDHIRMVKNCLLNSFAGWSGLILITGTEAAGSTTNDYVVTVSPAPAAYTTGIILFKSTHANAGACTLKINALTAKTLKDVDGGALASGDIANGAICVAYYDGTDFFLVSGNDKAALSGDTYTGTHDFTGATITVPTPASGSAAVTRDYMDAVVIAAGNLPDPTAHSGELLSSDGVSGSWITKINTTVMKLANGADPTKLLAFDLSGMTTGTTKTLIINNTAFTFSDPTDTTKRIALDLSNVSTATTRNVVVRNRNIVLTTPGTEWLQTVSASASSTIDVTGFDNATFDDYLLLLSGVRISATNGDLLMQFKVGGTLRTSDYYGHVENTGSGAATYAGAVISAASSLVVADDLGTDAATGGCDLAIWIEGTSSTDKHHRAHWKGEIFTGTGGTSTVKRACGVGGCGAATGALTEVRFLPSSGNIVVGSFKLYGIRAV